MNIGLKIYKDIENTVKGVDADGSLITTAIP